MPVLLTPASDGIRHVCSLWITTVCMLSINRMRRCTSPTMSPTTLTGVWRASGRQGENLFVRMHGENHNRHSAGIKWVRCFLLEFAPLTEVAHLPQANSIPAHIQHNWRYQRSFFSFSIPCFSLLHLQTHNSAAILLIRTKWRDRITHILAFLRWPPVCFKIDLLLITFKLIIDLAPC